jgi:hypothetical protein
VLTYLCVWWTRGGGGGCWDYGTYRDFIWANYVQQSTAGSLARSMHATMPTLDLHRP